MSLFYMMHGVKGALSGVTLTNASAAGDALGAGAQEATCGFRFNSDGTVDKEEETVYSQVNNGTDWIIPNSDASTTYYIRATQISLTANETAASIFDTLEGDVLSTWLTLGGAQTREWRLKVNSNSVGSGDYTWVIDVEIATDSGGTDILDIGRFTMISSVA